MNEDCTWHNLGPGEAHTCEGSDTILSGLCVSQTSAQCSGQAQLEFKTSTRCCPFQASRPGCCAAVCPASTPGTPASSRTSPSPPGRAPSVPGTPSSTSHSPHRSAPPPPSRQRRARTGKTDTYAMIQTVDEAVAKRSAIIVLGAMRRLQNTGRDSGHRVKVDRTRVTNT